jgi:hypothetical protein
MFIGIIVINPYGMKERLTFGPFDTYESADKFIQKKFFEYKDGECAFVDGLIAPNFRKDAA